ncbi:MAG: neutral zinc metallopeptidase [Propionicimonas sp.]|uniref:KPN_02809 family neutral zinc metallopeptidase n=1 Tax=Propionicimonas sp. TaxID=1955623 RepID=UPI002B20E021|nr:neutral zinc metallopeptidase [Propionicimonas sp.]MEA4945926.1 neutral zinc metallopeptidase [Propionicimonas sp.]MEA5116423.1 neutral zinc metallopeptidase [Propionicimonas sp.]
MQYRKGAKLDSSQMGYGGGGAGGKIALGGGAGILVLILALVFGLDPSALLGAADQTQQSQQNQPTQTGNPWDACENAEDIETNRDCRFVAYTNSIQAFWATQLGDQYVMTTTTPFTGQTATACGTATSDVGPFYCPADKIVYLDTSFFDQMLTGQLGARGGDAAEAYVIAHEYGHHISNLIGTLGKAQAAGNQTGPNSPQVKLELQADCFAGVWLANATNDPASPIEAITQDDLNRAVDAAIAVGDDRIQQMSTGGISPESWTHGSSEQRKTWMARGYTTGDPNQCDTFAPGALTKA